jgi:hypothetical protein
VRYSTWAAAALVSLAATASVAAAGPALARADQPISAAPAQAGAAAPVAEPDRHPASSDIAGQANTAAEPAQSAPGDLMSDINQSVAAAVRSESPPAEHCCR